MRRNGATVVLHHLSLCLFCLLVIGMAHVVEIAFVRSIKIKDYVARNDNKRAIEQKLNSISGTFLGTLFFLGCFVSVILINLCSFSPRLLRRATQENVSSNRNGRTIPIHVRGQHWHHKSRSKGFGGKVFILLISMSTCCLALKLLFFDPPPPVTPRNIATSPGILFQWHTSFPRPSPPFCVCMRSFIFFNTDLVDDMQIPAGRDFSIL
jgi:hypothetical protein